MVTLDQMIDVILLESGQYISDLDATLLNKDKIALMIQRELGWYSRYQPNKKTIDNFHLYNEKIFTQLVDGFVPTNIIDIRTSIFPGAGFTNSPMNSAVHNYYWRYESPKLYFRYPEGGYTLSYISPHILETVPANGTEPEYKVLKTIELHDRLINLVIGRFLMTVGKSRRAFTIDEIPINTDASDMISEGKQLYDDTVEEIKINNRFNLAVLV